MRAVITVVGKDTTGIIARVSTLLYENEVNILDISQTIMQGIFTMIMLVDITSSKTDIETLKDTLNSLAEKIGVEIHVQHEDVFNSMHRI